MLSAAEYKDQDKQDEQIEKQSHVSLDVNPDGISPIGNILLSEKYFLSIAKWLDPRSLFYFMRASKHFFDQIALPAAYWLHPDHASLKDFEKQNSPLHNLPSELFLTLTQFLEPRLLSSLMLVCKQFFIQIKDEDWKRNRSEHFLKINQNSTDISDTQNDDDINEDDAEDNEIQIKIGTKTTARTDIINSLKAFLSYLFTKNLYTKEQRNTAIQILFNKISKFECLEIDSNLEELDAAKFFSLYNK